MRALVIENAFGEFTTDFKAIGVNKLDRGLYVSEVVHKAFVETNKKGTEAAAATGTRMLRTKSKPASIDFTIDHPFVFAILYESQTLFMGNVTSFE